MQKETMKLLILIVAGVIHVAVGIICPTSNPNYTKAMRDALFNGHNERRAQLAAGQIQLRNGKYNLPAKNNFPLVS